MGARRVRLSKLRQPVPFKDRAAYERALKRLQQTMLRVQQAYYHQGRRGIVVLEGLDAAGKGGAIRRLTEALDARGVKVWPIGPPRAEEQGRHYLYRFWERLPEPGTLAVFDRSWYGRVLVERAERLTPPHVWRRAYDEINAFERMLTDDGVRIVKLFLNISKDEQLRRFAERLVNPMKHWKLSEADLITRELWHNYVQAIEEMLARTSVRSAPWHVVGANRKWRARVEVLRVVAETLGKGLDLEAPTLDPRAQRAACLRLGLDPAKVLGGSVRGRRR
jgi:AMP-polyphosphate phosphotransferase